MLTVRIRLDSIDCTERAREWCKLPYPDHPKGCPAYGKRVDCPPQAKRFNEVFEPPFFLVAVRFDLTEHVAKMLKKHPKWTEKQAKCVLYWQKTVEKTLRQKCEKLISRLPNGFCYTLKPEAMGINVFTTAFKHGIPIETRPKQYVWKIAVVGKLNSSYFFLSSRRGKDASKLLG